MTDYIEYLNDKQREAVFATEGYVRVIAGAGSGKTKLLVSRYAYLVNEYGIDPANILCVTFTNKAAAEMKRRIRALIGAGYNTNLISTYHGFCNRVIRDDSERLFMDKQFQIIDSHQQKAILTEIYQKHELKLDYASFEEFLKNISVFKKLHRDYVSRICSPENCSIIYENEVPDPKQRTLMEEYLQRQKATFSLDFSDLLYFALHLLIHHADVRDKWQQRLNYIMVDEFQDSSSVEMELIDILSDAYKNLLIVGDPDQNIYEWRGSDVELLVNFDGNHPGTNTIFLNRNYRSTPQILKCANTLIEKNDFRLKKDLYTENPTGAAVVHYHSKTESDEMDRIVENIKEIKRKEGYKYSDFAILYRSSFLSRVAEKKLTEKNIPYEIYGGVKFYQRMEVLDILAYLRLIAFDDDASFRRIINTPRRRFGRGKMNLLDDLFENGPRHSDYQSSLFDMFMEDSEPETETVAPKSLFSTLEANLDEPEFAKSDARAFVNFINKIRADIGKMRISEIVNRVSAESGYEKYIRELGDQERLDNLSELKRIANEFEREFGERLTLQDFLQQIALQSNDNDEEEKENVKLMTIHASKGLEFKVVFILGFTEGIFPSSKTIEERKKKGLEEERRLCYVAITRAQNYLFLMDSEGTTANGSLKLYSRLLDEIGEENYVRVGRISEELKRKSLSYQDSLNANLTEPEIPVAEMKQGARVVHHIFGEGTIESFDSRKRSYTIKFDKIAMPRTISEDYFTKKHEDVRGKIMPKQNEADKPKKNEEVILPTPVQQSAPPIENTADMVEQWQESETINIEGQNNAASYEESETETTVIKSEDGGKTITPEQQKALQERLNNSPNLWKHDDVPKSGWECTGVTDLGAPVGICEMCGYQIIRYEHHMYHPNYGELNCGCVCAGKMEGSVENAKRREADFKNRESRKNTFMSKTMRKSKKGNDYMKTDGHVIVLYHSDKTNRWRYSVDNEFCNGIYQSKEAAKLAAFEAVEKLRANNV